MPVWLSDTFESPVDFSTMSGQPTRDWCNWKEVEKHSIFEIGSAVSLQLDDTFEDLLTPFWSFRNFECISQPFLRVGISSLFCGLSKAMITRWQQYGSAGNSLLLAASSAKPEAELQLFSSIGSNVLRACVARIVAIILSTSLCHRIVL